MTSYRRELFQCILFYRYHYGKLSLGGIFIWLFSLLFIIHYMNELQFAICTDFDELWDAFWESPYFGHEAVTYREREIHHTNILIARVQWYIAWALTYSIIPYDNKLKIGLVEVLRKYLGNSIWTQLIIEAEHRSEWHYEGCLAYLNHARNTYSRNMFLKAGYYVFDTTKLYK